MTVAILGIEFIVASGYFETPYKISTRWLFPGVEAIEKKVDRLHGLHILRPILERTFKKDYNFNTSMF